MNLSPTEREERDLRARRTLQELGNLADQIAGLHQRAALAAVRGEWDPLCDTAEELLILHRHFARMYVFLLAAGRPSGSARRLALLHGEDERDGR